MKLTELQKHWNEWGKVDPLWAILSAPDKRDNKWDLGEFFERGKLEIALVMSLVRAENFPLRTGRALDFGCGVGRLSQALCGVFDEVYAVDIAPSMIEQAERYNQFGAKCHYIVNDVDNLRLFEDGYFDFIYTNIVLQHMRPEFSTGYIQEFVRVLAPGGLLIFQIPSHHIEVNAELDPKAVPLPEAAFLAEISVSEQSLTAATSLLHTFNVGVRNISTIAWPHITTNSGMYQLKLGNHWYDGAGSLLLLDDQRVPLPSGLAPQEQIELQLTVRMPSQPGQYRLILDLVQEGVAWFEHKGTKPAIVLVTVPGVRGEQTAVKAPAAGPTATATTITSQAPSEASAVLPETPNPALATSSPALPIAADADPQPLSGENSAFIPEIEMYGVPQPTVLEVIERAGGRPIRVIRDYSATEAWESYRYLITKD